MLRAPKDEAPEWGREVIEKREDEDCSWYCLLLKSWGLEDGVAIILQDEIKAYESWVKLLLLMSESDIVFGKCF